MRLGDDFCCVKVRYKLVLISNYFSSRWSLSKVLSFTTALFSKIVNIRKIDYTYKVLVHLVYYCGQVQSDSESANIQVKTVMRKMAAMRLFDCYFSRWIGI